VLDHVLIFGERHLRRILALYSSYYDQTRTHLALGKDAPLRRAVQGSGAIIATPILSIATVETERETRLVPRLVLSSLEPFALAATHEGAWCGADPTGYKFVRLGRTRSMGSSLGCKFNCQPKHIALKKSAR
jgi:hypothetical protein